MKSISSILGLSVLFSGIHLVNGADPTVKTTSGTVHGHSAPGVSNVSEYLGIPYAKPPTGDLRWATPEAFVGTSDIQADDFPSSCPAVIEVVPHFFDNVTNPVMTPQGSDILVALLGQVGFEFSEDCLGLNVWSKNSDTKKAVLVWIHGGSFVSGSSNITAYNGKYIADTQDVIVVSIHYRLGIFGFPGSPSTRTNLGLLDIRLAVQWVHDNIAAFGGDPDRITIVGQSAGGAAVDLYTFAWASDPLVAGFISQSGNVFGTAAYPPATQAATSWYKLSGKLGCGDAGAGSDTVVSCMRSKKWQDIHAAIASSSGSDTAGFAPTVDETVVFSDYPLRATTGKFAKKPLMIGNTDNEAGFAKPISAAQGQNYPDAAWDLLQYAIFTCSTMSRAAASTLYKIPTWRYRYFGDFPNLQITSSPISGAWHGSEIPLIFGTDGDVDNAIPRADAETKFSAYIMGAWVAFAKDPVNGLNKYGFPQYSPLNASLVRLGYNNQSSPQAVFPVQYDFGCPAASLLVNLISAVGSLFN